MNRNTVFALVLLLVTCIFGFASCVLIWLLTQPKALSADAPHVWAEVAVVEQMADGTLIVLRLHNDSRTPVIVRDADVVFRTADGARMGSAWGRSHLIDPRSAAELDYVLTFRTPVTLASVEIDLTPLPLIRLTLPDVPVEGETL